MTLHIFNPEHDIALASDLSNFTAPHAGRQLRYDLGWLPALWAEDGDAILVDNSELAERSWFRIAGRLKRSTSAGNKQFLTPHQLGTHPGFSHISPWGWDKALKAQLLRHGINKNLLPSDNQLRDIREMSHRRVSSTLLSQLRFAGTVGESFECQDAPTAISLLNRYEHVVMKAPWSSSGRGIRFVKEQMLQEGWLYNLISRQGSVMVEPYYNKVKDFGMEFYSNGQGTVNYLGLSLFHTENGAYTGNILATEERKKETITHYISSNLIGIVQERICTILGEELKGKYCGPLGVDMMVVSNNDQFLLHPCVEINLRRTMGHVALALSPADDDVQQVMRIEYTNNNYKLRFKRL